jgi:hypothetical protein
MMTKYRAYKSESESCIWVLVAGQEEELGTQNMHAADAVLLWEIDAHTYEEMMAIHSLRCGFGPYNPMGEPENCPKCTAYFYPQGSGDCWRCGKIC